MLGRLDLLAIPDLLAAHRRVSVLLLMLLMLLLMHARMPLAVRLTAAARIALHGCTFCKEFKPILSILIKFSRNLTKFLRYYLMKFEVI